MSFLPVAARSLHQQRVRLRDEVLERASFFPFFDPEGKTRALMLVWPPERPIVILPYQPGLVRIRWWGDVELRADFAALRDVDAGAVAAVGLWHYDPWWVLREECFRSHPAVPVLKATNCAGVFLKPVYGCYFNRDLSRLIGVAAQGKDASGLAIVDRTFVRFKPDLLPTRRSPVPASAAAGWRLDPTWRHRDWLSRFDV